MEPYKCAIHTKYGKYKLKATKDVKTMYSINAAKKEVGVILNLGGKDTNCIQNKVLYSVSSFTGNCIQIKVPYEGTVGKILWIQAGKQNECSIDNQEQRGEKLIHMVHLGITIAKEINPQLEFLELEDSASFDCMLPDGTKIAMNSTEHDMAFYQKSYYEKRYGAILINDRLMEQYTKDMEGFYDTSKKPLHFDFKNNDIEEELLPLYISSENWKEFFDKINKKYGNKKCTVVVLWIKSALRYIFNDRIYSGLDWKIDVNKIPKIVYEERVLETTGGTRKKKKYVKRSMLGRIFEMDWKKYFLQFN